MGESLLDSVFDDTGGSVVVCVDLFSCVDLGPFLCALYVFWGGGIRSVDFDKYVPHDSGKCVGGVAKFLLAATY